MNTIVNMFPSKVKEDNDALVRYFVEPKLVVREIVLKILQQFEITTVKIMLKNCVNIFVITKFLLSFFVSLFFP